MTRSLALCVVLLASLGAYGEEPDAAKPEDTAARAPPGKTPDTATVERARTPFEALTERLLGSSSRAVRFDWRTKTAGFGVVTSGLLELNNFASARVGAFVKIPYGDFVLEVAASRAIVWGSDSTEKLAQTPYRQYGRPNRFELDLNVDYVLAEGVVTPRPTFIPPAQLVFSVTAGFRYLIYTETWHDLTPGQVALAIFSPTLQDKELQNLDAGRLPAMQLDKGRYNVLLGFSLDIFFQPGLFVSPRVMLAIPLFSGLSGSGLGAWWELTARVGWML
jgi:hypothetical protein